MTPTEVVALAREVAAEQAFLTSSGFYVGGERGKLTTLARSVLSLASEVEAMRAVVEAAEAWRKIGSGQSRDLCSADAALAGAVDAIKEMP